MGSRELNHHYWRYGISQTSTLTALSITFPAPVKVRRIIFGWEATFSFWYCVLSKNYQNSRKMNLRNSSNNINLYWSCEKDNRASVYGPRIENACLVQKTWSRKSLKPLQEFFSTTTKRLHTCECLRARVRISTERQTGITKLQCLLRRGWCNLSCQHSFKFDMDLVNRAACH